ncbi:hypothetical protein ACVIU7_003380 [Bradyrhizobium liaoningense]|nr:MULTISPECIES: hypothetical protein [Bradyrhizobium]
MASYLRVVMAGLVPAIHVLPRLRKNVDARVKPGHDDVETTRVDDQKRR